MKKVLLPIISIILITGCYHNNNEILDVSMINLIATPEKYHNKDIRIIGAVNLEFEGNRVCLSLDDLEYRISKNCLWIELSQEISYDEVRNFNGKYVIIEGTFDIKNKGHFEMYSGSIVDITRYELWPWGSEADQAIDILHEKLKDNRLKYMVLGTDMIENKIAYNIRAYYDDGDHIDTKGYYLVVIENENIYQMNMVGNGYIEVE